MQGQLKTMLYLVFPPPLLTQAEWAVPGEEAEPARSGRPL